MRGMMPWHEKVVATRWPAVVVVTVPKPISHDEAERFREVLCRTFGRRQRILVLDGGVKLDLVRKR